MLSALLLVAALTHGPVFDIQGYGSSEALAAELEVVAPKLHREVNRALNVPVFKNVPTKIRIELTPQLGDAATHGLDWSLPKWAAGAARPDQGRILLTVHADGKRHNREQVLKHELAHLAVSAAAKGHKVPRWFNEGIARHLAGEHGPQDSQLLAQARLARRIPRLVGLVQGFPRPARDASLAYATSGRAVSLLVKMQGPDILGLILSDLATGASFDDVLHNQAGIRTWQLTRRVRDSVALFPALLTVMKDMDLPLALSGLLIFVAWGRLRKKRRAQLLAMEPIPAPLDPTRLNTLRWTVGKLA